MKLSRPAGLVGLSHLLWQERHERGVQLHQALVLRQALQLLLRVPAVQGLDHLVKLDHLLLELNQT